MSKELIQKLKNVEQTIITPFFNDAKSMPIVERRINEDLFQEILGFIEFIETNYQVRSIDIEKVAREYEQNEDNEYIEKAFIDGAIWMHDFANNSEAMKLHAIKFHNFVYGKPVDKEVIEYLYTKYLTNKEK